MTRRKAIKSAALTIGAASISNAIGATEASANVARTLACKASNS